MFKNIKDILLATPNLKAKEIAKQMGKERKVVNSFLYSHKEDFIKDDDYCWSLLKSEKLVIELEKNKWVDCTSFEKSLSTADSPFGDEYSSIIFVIPEECNILLDASARLLALCNQLLFFGKKVTVDFNNCKSTLSYFDRIGFLGHLNNGVTVLPRRPLISKADIYKGNNSAVVEFGEVVPNQANKGLVNELTDCFVEQSDSRFETAAFTVFSEFIDNISGHSETNLPGFAALQKYKWPRKHIQTVVSDSGLGIATTLKPSLATHHPDLFKLSNNIDFDLELVTAVLTKGEISRFGSGRGLGFKSSRVQATKFDARLSVRQEDFSLNIEYKDGALFSIIPQKNLSTIYGTHICFDFFVD